MSAIGETMRYLSDEQLEYLRDTVVKATKGQLSEDLLAVFTELLEHRKERRILREAGKQ